MSYWNLLERIAGLDRVESIRVRPFEIIAGGSLQYLDDFLGNVGLTGKLDLGVFEDDPSANRSYSEPALDLALSLNPYLDTADQRAEMKRFLRQRFPVGEFPSAQIIDEESRERIIAAYAFDNERMFSTWMPELPFDAYSTVDGADALRGVLAPLGV